MLDYFRLNIYCKQFEKFTQGNIGVPIHVLDIQAPKLIKYTTTANSAQSGSTT